MLYLYLSNKEWETVRMDLTSAIFQHLHQISKDCNIDITVGESYVTAGKILTIIFLITRLRTIKKNIFRLIVHAKLRKNPQMIFSCSNSIK